MKQRRTFRFVQVGAVLSLLALLLPPSPTLAADRLVQISPDEGGVGDRVRVWGNDYDKDYPDSAIRYGYVFVTVYFSSDLAEIGDRIGVEVDDYEIVDASDKLDEFGDWETTFKVPEDLTGGKYHEDVEEGDYYIYVTYWGDDVIIAANIYEVTDVPEEWYPVHYYWRGYPGGMWGPYPWWPDDECCCNECDDDCWDGYWYYPVPPCDWDEEDWDEDWPCPWPPDDWDEDWDEDWPHPWPPFPPFPHGEDEI